MNLRCNLPAKVYLALKYTPYKTWLRPINLSYKLIGEGSNEPEQPPIFILHGLLSRRKHWKSLAKIIYNLTKRTVIIVDQRNHGFSPHVNSHRYEEMAQDVIQLLDKLKLQKVSLIGYSMGGRTAMCTALTAPKRVSSLIVVDISPSSTDPHFLKHYNLLVNLQKMDFKFPKKVYKARREARKVLKKICDDDVLIAEILSNIHVKSDGIIGWICNHEVLIKHFQYIASFPPMKGKRYKGPTLFIGGQLSDYIPPDDLPHIRDLFPRAVITYISNTTHHLPLEDPKAFLELVFSFLKTNI